MIDPFVVKCYSGDKSPTIKGNGFDGLIIGEDRQEAESFIAFVNKIIEERNALNAHNQSELSVLCGDNC